MGIGTYLLSAFSVDLVLTLRYSVLLLTPWVSVTDLNVFLSMLNVDKILCPFRPYLLHAYLGNAPQCDKNPWIDQIFLVDSRR